ncbi:MULTISPECIES: type IV pilin N-terminal domain-containing protein [unclassified Methanoculleus]|uniref:type IV pilin N-terminal domain-containing protein n=1 Tax=unclassified Methanoculleus TaxID=2619537 RepID=UPI0025EF6FBF|nr:MULTISPECIES: type IV pilin N-terminal domain-containing protein [unclassified Methanoculleus]
MADTDGGISEVVSVLLMVAIVVALAAITASTVLRAQMPEEPKRVVVTATRSGEAIAFTNHGGMNMDRVTEIRCWIGGTGPGDENFTLDTRAGATGTRVVPGAARVVVVGRFEDKESWVLVDRVV